MAGAIPATLDKVEAVQELAARAGLAGIDAEGPKVADGIAAIGRALGRLSNPQVSLADGKAVPGARVHEVIAAAFRVLPPPLHLSGMPGCFTDGSPRAHTPDFSVLELPDGYFCDYRDAPLVVTPGGELVARDFSSRFAGLVHFYEMPLRRVMADAVHIDGTVLVLADDVRPLNYCHWIVDWLPRLAFLGEQVRQPDFFVAVPPLDAGYQWETLRLCGIPRERVVQLDAMQALRAKRLLAPNDLPVPPHPGHKSAPWLLDYLRGRLGYGAFLAGMDGPTWQRKLFVSRNDAKGRRLLNEDALFAALAPLGYERIVPGGMSAARQISAFAGASHIVALHGAALANVVFADPAATLVEMFPATYGTAAYYVLAAGTGLTYASYISHGVAPGSRPQLDAVTVDIADFMARCRHLL